jgi:hypothetical protein
VTAQYDLTIQQGATYRRTFRWLADGDPVSLTGFVARMQIRRSVRAPEVLVSATTENGRLTLNAPAGEVSLELPASVTAAITARTGVYDLELEDAGGVVTRLVEGAVEFVPEVTRD